MTFTKERIIEELKASTQNASGMFEITEDTICALMELLESRADAEPVAVPQFRAVADLYEMQFEDGHTLAFHTDPEKAVQWLNTCTGNKVQEYVKLERLQEVYTRPQPAPVVPDIGEIRVGRLPTMNQDDYPGIGDWWVQLRIGEDSDEILARVYGATPQEANSRAEALACRAAMLQGKAEPLSQPYTLPDDKQRLDWLDAQNKRLNEYYGTAYGWKFDANFQRNAMMLNDSNYPVMNVRQAIDEAMRTATRLQEALEVKK